MRRAWLLIAGFCMAGCAMALLLLSNGLLQMKKPEYTPAFTPAEDAPEALMDRNEGTVPLQMPCKIPGTDLLAVRLGSYEGPFLEDGSDRNVFDVAMLQIKNTGGYMIKNAFVELLCDKKKYTFEIWYLPPGATVLALDLTGQKSITDAVYSLTGRQTVIEDTCFGLQGLEIQDPEMGRTLVTNRTDRAIADLKLYYKSVIGDEACFVGGNVYAYRINHIAPGETIALNLPHYAKGYSRIVAAEQLRSPDASASGAIVIWE